MFELFRRATTLKPNIAGVHWDPANVWSAFKRHISSIKQRITEAQCAINIIYGDVLEGLHAFIYNLCPRLPLYLLLKSCAWCFSSWTTVIYRVYVLGREWSLAAEATQLKQPVPPVFLHAMVCLLGSVNHNINIKSWCQRNITRSLSRKQKK